ncbi:MAG: DUF2946 family protein [Undibacterium curvum]|uniref:DUF2946 family protein n=1 Tax=Undibacterium curvum TaxID=2762294 RepID=UPI003BE7C070
MMDEIVKAAMTKWPNVPHCFGWLALDARGQWRMRDERCQALGLPGDIIRHPSLISFIQRNYTHDEDGRWYFQNGPQRVYVDLEAAPYICTLSPTHLQLHTGTVLHQLHEAVMDEAGRLFFVWDHNLCLLEDRDIADCLDRIRDHQAQALSTEALMHWIEADQSSDLWLELPGIAAAVRLRKGSAQSLKSSYPFQATPRLDS